MRNIICLVSFSTRTKFTRWIAFLKTDTVIYLKNDNFHTQCHLYDLMYTVTHFANKSQNLYTYFFNQPILVIFDSTNLVQKNVDTKETNPKKTYKRNHA